jgi:hypothetical protein
MSTGIVIGAAGGIGAACSRRPDEVARLVEFVVLHAPPYLTGARIAVDGGTEALG